MPKCRVQVCSSTEMHFSDSFGDMGRKSRIKNTSVTSVRRYLNLHKTADHPEEGADVKQFPCDYLDCEKIDKSPDALRIHKKLKTHYVA